MFRPVTALSSREADRSGQCFYCSDRDFGYWADDVFRAEPLPEQPRPVARQRVCALHVVTKRV